MSFIKPAVVDFLAYDFLVDFADVEESSRVAQVEMIEDG